MLIVFGLCLQYTIPGLRFFFVSVFAVVIIQSLLLALCGFATNVQPSLLDKTADREATSVNIY